jgi:hypothetical protein
MIDIIIALLMMIGIDVNNPETGGILVIDTSDGATYGLGSVATVGNKPPEEVDPGTQVFYLVQLPDGSYELRK